MSRLSTTARIALEDLFSKSNNRLCSLYYSKIDNLNYLNNNIFGLFLHIDCTGPYITVPLFCRILIEEMLYAKENTTDIDIALFVNDCSSERKTFNSIFKLFTEVSFSRRLTKIITSKGEIYYGGYGVILDRNMTPIFFCTLEGEVDEEKNLTYKSAKIYISPLVFISDSIIEKGIIKTVIPFYIERGTAIYTSFSNINKQFNNKTKGSNRIVPEIIIKDFTDDFFVKPSKPKPSTFTKDKVDDFLLEHIDDIRLMSYL